VSRTNVLDYTTGDANGNYTNGGWQDTGQTNILSGGNGSGIVTNMTDAGIPSTPTNRYYRVRVLLPFDYAAQLNALPARARFFRVRLLP
jgi:hypothetical protein